MEQEGAFYVFLCYEIAAPGFHLGNNAVIGVMDLYVSPSRQVCWFDYEEGFLSIDVILWVLLSEQLCNTFKILHELRWTLIDDRLPLLINLESSFISQVQTSSAICLQVLHLNRGVRVEPILAAPIILIKQVVLVIVHIPLVKDAQSNYQRFFLSNFPFSQDSF